PSAEQKPEPAQEAPPVPACAPSAAAHTPFESGAARQGRILSVDDEYANLAALSNILTLAGYGVTSASSAAQAFLLLERAQPPYDLCILDAMMPGMSGYEACTRLRKRYSPLDLPVLILTARSRGEDLQAGFQAGANDFLEKPFDHTELICRINTLIQLKKSKDMLLERETAFLQAQIRPHFIFNALNTINSFCYTAPRRAAELLGALSVFLRNSFDFKSTVSVVPLEHELDLIRAYVDLEQARFGERVQVGYEIGPEARQYGVMPLSIQPLVENAIRHCIGGSRGRCAVRIRVACRDETLYAEVSDDGDGIPDEVIRQLAQGGPPARGVGLWNINQRLQSFFGASLRFDSPPEGGSRVGFAIPAQRMQDASSEKNNPPVISGG
ncbi:MAG TPA: response regulator, partial [Feifaniaceae bacterium]|nr:response regulator [Feifaniaceae bacterium]